MGHYYNAGDCKSCRGSNTSLSDDTHVVLMDFYMPPRTFYFQHAPDMRWKHSKQSAQPRKSNRPFHNTVTKDAYWKATSTGASEEEARQMGIDAVVEHVKSKAPPKAPTPRPTPELEPDLGSHLSGSATMEHGQGIPNSYFGEKRKADEEHTWRCDVNHGLGRYYLAGDKKSRPGCGSSQNGSGKNEEMGFIFRRVSLSGKKHPAYPNISLVSRTSENWSLTIKCAPKYTLSLLTRDTKQRKP